MSRDTTLGATWRTLRDLGYAATSATHPDRLVSPYSRGRRDNYDALAEHPGALMLHPSVLNGCDLDAPEKRGVVALTVTAYLQSDARQYKAVMAVLAERELTGGPCRIDSFGNHVHLLKWNGPPIYDEEYQARQCFDADDLTLVLTHATKPDFTSVRDQWGGQAVVPRAPIGTNIVPIDGEWKDGHVLDVPRRKLPELHHSDVAKLIGAVEEARWGARPLTNTKEAA